MDLTHIPTSMLWIALAPTFVALILSINFLSRSLKLGELSLMGRVLADQKKSPLLFWTLFADGILVGGLSGFVLITLLVELFLVRA